MNVIDYEGAFPYEIAYETYLIIEPIGRISLLSITGNTISELEAEKDCID